MKKNLNFIPTLVLIVLIIIVLISYFGSQKYSTSITADSNNNQPISNIEQQLVLTKSKYALLIQSQAIDEYPVWSKDGQAVYVNEEGQWKKILLSQVRLNSGIWRGDIPIGINSNKKSITIDTITQKELDTLLSLTPHDQRDLTLLDGTRVQLEQDLFSTSLKITLPGQSTHTEWTSGGENCHSIVLSPDKQYVLFQCELNGVLLMEIKS